MKRKGNKLSVPAVFLLILVLAASWFLNKQRAFTYSDSVQNVPDFSGEPFVVIHDNQPEFMDEDLTTDSYAFYSELDYLGRCGYAMACVGRDLMPTEERQSISQVKPTGWVQNQYEFVDGKNLYNRCHLIGFQLTGENANEKNLITGTRYCNVEGMLPFENMVADYIKETANHVLYRVTPVFDGESLVCRGIQMEALSVEDQGSGICFHVYVYNSQPGVVIDYLTGENWSTDSPQETTQTDTAGETVYILNTKSKKFHLAQCKQAQDIKAENKENYTGGRQLLIARGYNPGGCCNP